MALSSNEKAFLQIVGGFALAGVVFKALAPKSRPGTNAPPSSPTPHPLAKDPFVEHVAQRFDEVMRELGISRVPLYVDGAVSNFRARAGQVEFNPHWAREVIERHCSDDLCTSSILCGLFGHEIAHIQFNDPPYDPDQCQRNHDGELRADAVGGWVLAKIGAPRDHFQALLEELAHEWSCTHPPAADRIAAIEHGYMIARRGLPWQQLRHYRHT